MISKAFQNIVTQMADVFPKKFGIVDSHGLVLANNGGEPTGDIIENLVYAATNNDKLLFKDGYTVRSMSNKPYAEYVVYVEGTDEVSKYCCNSIVVAANNVRHYYDEKYDKNNFMQNIIFDNLLSFDLHQKARELHVDIDIPRAVFYIKVLDEGEVGIYDVLRNMFPDKERDFVFLLETDSFCSLTVALHTRICQPTVKIRITSLSLLSQGFREPFCDIYCLSPPNIEI